MSADFESLTTLMSLTAVHSAVHQHVSFLITGYWFLSGTCERHTLDTHSDLITNTLLTATLPGVTDLFNETELMWLQQELHNEKL